MQRKFLFAILCIFVSMPIMGIKEDFAPSQRHEQEASVHGLFTQFPSAMAHSMPWLQEGDIAWKELDMDLVVKTLDRTLTVAGQYQFNKLMCPLRDLTELGQRQTVCRELVENTAAFSALETMFDEYKEHEWLLLDLFTQKKKKFFDTPVLFEKRPDAMAKETLAQLDQLDQNIQAEVNYKFLLNTWNNLFPYVKARVDTIMHVMHFLQPYSLRTQQIIAMPKIWLFTYYFFFETITNTYQRARTNMQGLDNYSAARRYFTYVNNIIPLVIFTDTIIRHVIDLPNLLVYVPLNQFNEINSTIKNAHNRMINLARVIENLDILEAYIPKDCWQVHDALKQWYAYLNPKSPTYSANLYEFVELLEKGTFQETPSAGWTSFTDICKAFSYMDSCKSQLATLVHAYAAADACLSVARLYKECEQNKQPVTWARYTNDTKPTGYFDNIRNPLVPNNQTVANSFSLGGDALYSHIMLTGPHGCGKTTSMKSIAYAYLMGQSLSLVFGDKAIFTPLNAILTYLNITDNLEEGLSSFMAENKRIQELITKAKNLSVADICLMLIDEPYAKTLQAVGEQEVYDFVKLLASIPQLMMLIATHFEKPALLEEELHGLIKNYQPELLEPTPNVFIRTFKMLEGSAKQWFEDAAWRDRFIDWLGEVAS